MYKIKQLPEDFRVTEQTTIRPGKNGRYTYFLLSKRNYTTEDAIQTIARSAHAPRKFFGYAGNKDKTAITEQLCSASIPLKDLTLQDITVTVQGYGDKPISLGDLSGNRFEIIVRNIDQPPAPITQLVNYFDTQRFGIHNDNQLVGKSIVKRDFKAAVERIIADKASRELTDYLTLHPNDYVGTLRTIPKKTLSIYVNAYQSDLWNRAAKEYVRRTGKDTPSITIPLPGYGTEFTDPLVEEIMTRLLAEDTITLRDFIIRAIPEIASEGGERELFATVKDLTVSPLEDDELNAGMKKCDARFFLGKGSYATVVVREMFS